MITYSPFMTEQDARQHTVGATRPPLIWLLLSAIGGALAFAILAGTLAGRIGVPITKTLLLGGAAIGVLPRLWLVLRGRWAVRWPEAVLGLLAFVLLAAVGLWLAWPALLPLGRSVDAVHQYQLVRWIAEEQRLPPVDGETRGLMGEMVAYPTGFAFVVSAVAALARSTPLDTLFPMVALLGGLCAALVAQLAAGAAGVRGWRIVLPGLAAIVLLLAHRTYFLEAYADHSYYAQMLGLALALLACGWLVCEGSLGYAGALQLGVLLAALLATYPLWTPVPLALAMLVLLARRPRNDGQRPLRNLLVRLALLFAPIVVIAVIDLPARLATGQVVLEHQGVVTQPTLFALMPLVLAVPAGVALFATRGRQGDKETRRQGFSLYRFTALPLYRFTALPLLTAFGLAGLAMAALALAAQFGLIAPYHSIKMLFLLIPLAVAVTGAALIRLTVVPPLALRWAVLAACAGALWFTSGRFVLPFEAEQLPNRDLVAAAEWLRENDPKAADRTVLVGAPAGPLGYWLQVALLGQRRDAAKAAVLAFTTTPPTPEGWAIDSGLPTTAVAPDLAEAPPGSEIAARFGHMVVLRRTALDRQAANPLVLRYASRWEEGRLKTAFELIRPIAGSLPLIELRLLQNGALVNTFALQPNAERTKPQYLGADLVPETLGGVGYINAEAYPNFAPPTNAPAGRFELMLRLSYDQQTLDERLLATFDRSTDGVLANQSLHSGELDYLRREYATALDSLDVRFGETVTLTGWTPEGGDGTVSALLRWQAQAALRAPLATELRLLDTVGTVVARSRGAPQDGFYPTWRWRTGEDVIERRTLALPPDLPAGTYTLQAAVFDETTHAEILPKTSADLGSVVVK